MVALPVQAVPIPHQKTWSAARKIFTIQSFLGPMQRSLAISCMLLVAVAVAGTAGHAAAEAGVSLDSVTFIEYPDGVPALEAVSNGTLDMHTFQIPRGYGKECNG